MPSFPHLSKAPITEALIDFRVIVPDNFSLEGKKDSVQERIDADYDKIRELRRGDLQVEIGDSGLVGSDTGFQRLGYAFEAEEPQRVGQFRKDGFTFNRLKPYSTWDDMFAEAFELWRLYLEVFEPEKVTRVATRYINRIRIPESRIKLDEYFVRAPDSPPNCPDLIETFLSRVVTYDEESEIRTITTLANEASDQPDTILIILDIDCSMTVAIEPADDSVGPLFDGLREMKNRFFFNSVTQKTLALFS